MKTKSVIYARVSTDHQQTANQIEELRRYANANNFSIEKEFDESISGTIEDREELTELKEYVKSRQIKQILCYEISRLGRTTKHTINLIDYFKQEGVNIYLKKENLNTLSNEPKDTFLLNILASIADLETSTIKARMSMGRDRSARSGTRAGMGFLPYGFTTDEKKILKVDEKEAEVVKEIFSNFLEGMPMYRIANILNSKNILTRRQMFNHKRITSRKGNVFELKWRNNAIYNILKNPIYKGERRYKGEIINISDHIINPKQWQEVQEKLKLNIGKKVTTSHKYIFRGKLICGICDYQYQARTEARYNGQSYYYCNGKSDAVLRCKGGQIKCEMLDDILYDNIFNRDFSTLAQYFENMYKSKTSLVEMEKQIINLNSEIDIIEIKKKKVRNLWVDGHYSSQAEYEADWLKFNKEQNEIKNTIKDIQMQIQAHNNINISDKIKEIRLSWVNLNNKEDIIQKKRDIVQKYVDKVLIYPVEKYERKTFLEKSIVWEKANRIGKSEKNDKLVYIELFAFKARHPITFVFSTWTKRFFYGKNKVQFNEKTKELIFI